jgi:hypothetical protein
MPDCLRQASSAKEPAEQFLISEPMAPHMGYGNSAPSALALSLLRLEAVTHA